MFVDIFTTQKKYNVIYADPPWAYIQSGSKNDNRGMAKKHYSTMATEDICKLPVNAICFMWATFPNIGEALKVMSAWALHTKRLLLYGSKKIKRTTQIFGAWEHTRARMRKSVCWE